MRESRYERMRRLRSEICRYIREYVDENGSPPRPREVCRRFGISECFLSKLVNFGAYEADGDVS